MTSFLAQNRTATNPPLVFGDAPPAGAGGAQGGASISGRQAAGAAPGAPAPAPMPLGGGTQGPAATSGQQAGGPGQGGAPGAPGQGSRSLGGASANGGPQPGAATGAPVARLPHGIRGAVPYVPWPTLLLFAVLLLGAVLTLVTGVRWWRRRAAGRLATPVDPWDALKARLAGLAPAGAFGPKEREEYFFQLSLLLREAVELRTLLRATDLTWQELREPLRRKLPLPVDEIEAVLSFLERADLVKFAGAPANLREAEAARERCRGWVEQLTPRSIDAGPRVAGAGTSEVTDALR